jgi:hypothetical protein
MARNAKNRYAKNVTTGVNIANWMLTHFEFFELIVRNRDERITHGIPITYNSA